MTDPQGNLFTRQGYERVQHVERAIKNSARGTRRHKKMQLRHGGANPHQQPPHTTERLQPNAYNPHQQPPHTTERSWLLQQACTSASLGPQHCCTAGRTHASPTPQQYGRHLSSSTAGGRDRPEQAWPRLPALPADRCANCFAAETLSTWGCLRLALHAMVGRVLRTVLRPR